MEEKRFDAVAWWFHRHGFRPDHFTYAQTPVYVVLVVAALRDEPWAFFVLTVFAVLLDGADGVLARRTGTVTRRGHLLDAFYDIVGIGVTLWAAAQMYPDAAGLPYVALPPIEQLLLVLLVINFLVYVQNEIQGTKAITYTRGPVTGGIVLEQYWEGLLVIGVLLPLLIGTALLFTRVAWRKRLWNWYSFLTAGRRKEYKSVPRRERPEYGRHPARFPPRRPRSDDQDEDDEDDDESNPADERRPAASAGPQNLN